MEEFEIKFLDIEKEKLESKLKELGAQKVGEYHYRRTIFDHADFRLDASSAFLRLRDESEQVTLAFKQRLGVVDGSLAGDDDGMYEREVVVSDFDATRDILLRSGLVEKMYQENKRTRYMLDGVEFDIDEWPLIPAYLEIEGRDWESVYAAAEALGFKKENAKKFTANQVYKLNGLDDRNYSKLTFEEQVLKTENLF